MPDVEYYAVDRFEGELVVLIKDSGDVVSVPRKSLPSAVEEGAVLRVPLTPGGEPTWRAARVEESETERRRQEARAILRELRERDPGGDVEL